MYAFDGFKRFFFSFCVMKVVVRRRFVRLLQTKSRFEIYNFTLF